MQDVARRALSHYCSLFSGVVDDLDLKYYPRRSADSARDVIVSPVGEGNPRLNSMVNVAAVLNTELGRPLTSSARLGRRLQNYVLSVRRAMIRMVVPPLLSGFNTLTAHRLVVVMLMAPLIAGPR
jgi:hypothetical protein